MIITVTLNPAVDRTVAVDELRLGEVNRVSSGRSDPGGKGINVSRVLRELDTDSLAMGFVAGSLGRFVEASLNEIGIKDDFVHVPGQTRTNLGIVERLTGRQTALNEPGPAIEGRFLKELPSRLRRRLTVGDWVVMAGSVPPGVPPSCYAELIAMAREEGASPVLDADGKALALGIAAQPVLVKPNLVELEHLLGSTIAGDSAIIAAAKELRGRGITYVVVSLGADGAIAAGPGEVWRGYPPPITVQSTTGAGDSLVAGLVRCLASGQGLVDGLRLGMAAGAATALLPGTMLCQREDVERLLLGVRLERVE